MSNSPAALTQPFCRTTSTANIPLDNPYSSPQNTSGETNLRRMRLLSIVTACIAAGGLAALLVYVGEAFRWPHFSNREGYFGTDFISSLLYAIGDPHAIHIVAVLWFSYAASFVFIL